MSYLSGAIEFERERNFHMPGVNPPREPNEIFEAGLLAGFKIAVHAYGIWQNGSQRIGASDKTIQGCMEEFKSALDSSQQDKQETK